MKIESKLFGDIAVMTLHGELDSRGHQQLDRAIKELIEGQIYKIVLDLSSIRFMGQQTVGLLISHMKELRANGGDIRFLNPQRVLMQYLKQNRVIELFTVFSTRAEALDSFKIPPKETAPSNKPLGEKGKEPKAPSATTRTASPSGPSSSAEPSTKARFETGEILYANSCMLATLIKMLEAKGMITSEEASELMNYESLSLKGVGE